MVESVKSDGLLLLERGTCKVSILQACLACALVLFEGCIVFLGALLRVISVDRLHLAQDLPRCDVICALSLHRLTLLI